MWGDPLQEDLAISSVELYKKVIAYQKANCYIKKNDNSSGELMRLINRMADHLMIEMLEKNRAVYSCKATKKFVIMLPNGDIKPCHLKNDK